jgi:hypothetical protein
MTGLDDFKRLLKEFNYLSVWASAGSVVLPFVASFIAIIPPWPAGLNIITSIFQLLSLIVVYQLYSGAPRRIITRNITILFCASIVIMIAYTILFSMLTIYVPPAHRSIVVGFECTEDAKRVFGSKCPSLSLDDLMTVAFDEFLLWTKSSIAISRAVLIAMWFVFFISLAGLIGTFLVYQMKRKIVRFVRKT